VASWTVDVTVGDGATLIWDAEPFIAAAGSDTVWTARFTLAERARLRLRETLVLGRHGERPGRLQHHLEVVQADGVPILVDALDLGPGGRELVLGGRRVLGSSLFVGLEDHAVAGTRYELEQGGVLVRSLADEMHLL